MLRRGLIIIRWFHIYHYMRIPVNIHNWKYYSMGRLIFSWRLYGGREIHWRLFYDHHCAVCRGRRQPLQSMERLRRRRGAECGHDWLCFSYFNSSCIDHVAWVRASAVPRYGGPYIDSTTWRRLRSDWGHTCPYFLQSAPQQLSLMLFSLFLHRRYWHRKLLYSVLTVTYFWTSAEF